MQGLANTSKNGLRFKVLRLRSLVARRVRFWDTLDCRDKDFVGSPNLKDTTSNIDVPCKTYLFDWSSAD